MKLEFIILCYNISVELMCKSLILKTKLDNNIALDNESTLDDKTLQCLGVSRITVAGLTYSALDMQQNPCSSPLGKFPALILGSFETGALVWLTKLSGSPILWYESKVLS
jgi:hypothetical protein